MSVTPRSMGVRRFHVAALAETSGRLGRSIYRGIGKFARENPWNLHIEVGTAEHLGGLAHWKGDGLICRARSIQVATAVAMMNVPRVVFGMIRPNRTAAPMLQMPMPVAADDAKLVFDYFIERGFRNFAFVPFTDERGTLGRAEPLARLLSEAGLILRQFESGPPARSKKSHAPPSPQAQLQQLSRWLADQPQPLAVWAANDLRGQQVIAACRMADLRVPEHVAIVGHGNDDLLCSLCTPPLSSVDEPYELIGYEAARMLQIMMTSGQVPTDVPTFSPIRVVTRESSDLIAIEDADVASALQLMRSRLADRTDVNTILEGLSLSRTTLQRKFKSIVGRSPAQEIARLRLERARELITTTTLTMKQVAVQSGYGSTNRMYDAFRKHLKLTPGQLRAKN